MLRNHFLWTIVNLRHKDKEYLVLRNNFMMTKKFLTTKFDWTTLHYSHQLFINIVHNAQPMMLKDVAVFFMPRCFVGMQSCVQLHTLKNTSFLFNIFEMPRSFYLMSVDKFIFWNYSVHLLQRSLVKYYNKVDSLTQPKKTLEKTSKPNPFWLRFGYYPWAGPSQGLNFRGVCSTMVDIICPPGCSDKNPNFA